MDLKVKLFLHFGVPSAVLSSAVCQYYGKFLCKPREKDIFQSPPASTPLHPPPPPGPLEAHGMLLSSILLSSLLKFLCTMQSVNGD